jgi:hydrogenase nickel incorporation protein HypA/HybF
MHELAVCQSIMQQVDEIARSHGAHGVARIKLLIGPLSGVEPDLLRNAFPIAAAGSVAEGATLDIEPQPLSVRCRSCGAETQTQPNRLTCGVCGDWHTEVVSGDEMILASLELINDPQKERMDV